MKMSEKKNIFDIILIVLTFQKMFEYYTIENMALLYHKSSCDLANLYARSGEQLKW